LKEDLRLLFKYLVIISCLRVKDISVKLFVSYVIFLIYYV